MPRALWKGAISFGLVHIPVELYPSHNAPGIDLDMLDRRDFSPVGYKRYNKTTGKEIHTEDIVKGYQYEKGEYVVLTDAEIRQANKEATQTIDIQAFVKVNEISPLYFEQPYYLKPAKGGEKVYALLRETLRTTDRIGIAQIVMRTKQHLAALMVVDQVIVLNMLRYAEDIRPPEELGLPGEDAPKVRVSDKEIKMAHALVEDMTEPWDPEQFHDRFRADIMALVKKKIRNKQTHALMEPEDEVPADNSASNIVDLMALLKESIGRRMKPEKEPSGNKTDTAEEPPARRKATRR
ncbi:non-homologous end joining protein Ku [Methylovorus mays]|uniref:non-homologous end joining protein Ku n=1 Tax=Methylovorus mays TaxID=184077 RepID=UPI001E5232C5|nr:Ku protein [Methylovorus mays]MCB5208083.1 Ku protein [Methylovorus mays]